jgi:hypothetical protein
MKFLFIFSIIIYFGSYATFAAEKNKKKTAPSPVKATEVSKPQTVVAPTEIAAPVKPIPTHTLNDLDLNCLNRGNSECRSKEGAKCELINLHGSEILRMQIDEDSTPSTFIIENKYKKCESYWVTEQCRIIGADICDSEQKVKLFGPAPIPEPSIFDSLL